jgi:hypothetical protein
VIEVAETVAGVKTSEPKFTTVLAAKLVPAIVRYCRFALPLIAIGGDNFEIAGKTGGGGGGVASVKKTMPVIVPTLAVAEEGPATTPVTKPLEETVDDPSVADVQVIGSEMTNALPY